MPAQPEPPCADTGAPCADTGATISYSSTKPSPVSPQAVMRAA